MQHTIRHTEWGGFRHLVGLATLFNVSNDVSFFAQIVPEGGSRLPVTTLREYPLVDAVPVFDQNDHPRVDMGTG